MGLFECRILEVGLFVVVAGASCKWDLLLDRLVDHHRQCLFRCAEVDRMEAENTHISLHLVAFCWIQGLELLRRHHGILYVEVLACKLDCYD